MQAILNILGENFIAFTTYASSFFIYALSVVLVFVFWDAWVTYRRVKFLAERKDILLQVKVPRDVPKSPLAMEIVLGTFHQTFGETTIYDRYLLGKVRNHFSLEIVSVEGDVRFLIWTNVAARKFIETQIYSQYPNAEVKEVSDYTADIPYAKEGSDWDLFGVEWTLSKPDPYPIKTYVDYGLEKDPKEEFKVDPMLSVLEWLGDMGRGEQGWLQIIVRANKGKKDYTTSWRNRDWQDEGRALIEKIMQDSKKRAVSSAEQVPGEQDFRFMNLTEEDRNVIKALSRSLEKHGFDCGIRILYLAKKNAYDAGNVAGLFGTFKQYSSNTLNGFKPRDMTKYDFPWQDYINLPKDELPMKIPFFSLAGRRGLYRKWKYFDAYRKRSWFYPPYERKPFVLNAEELATIYHFPGQVAETPTFKRIESQKAEPPPNLPV